MKTLLFPLFVILRWLAVSCNNKEGSPMSLITLLWAKCRLKLESDGKVLHLDTPYCMLTLSNSFTLPARLLFNVDYRMRSKGYSENYYFGRTRHLLGASLWKSFMGEALDITLGMSDILYKNNPSRSVYPPYMRLSVDNKLDTRELYLTVRYNFNTSKNRYKGTGAGTETLRRL